MPLYISYHSKLFADTTFDARGEALPILGPVQGNAVTVTISGTAANAAASAGDYLVKILTTEACRIANGSAVTATANSEYFAADSETVRFIKTGDRLSVITP